jgi:hypothetical protein
MILNVEETVRVNNRDRTILERKSGAHRGFDWGKRLGIESAGG